STVSVDKIIIICLTLVIEEIKFELMKDGTMLTVLSILVSALAWPATLVTTFDFINSRWAIAVERLVILVDFSLRARAIFKCLQYFAIAERDN
ncbi:hypothetical protein S83_008201, partial [Arachis hypogaea]